MSAIIKLSKRIIMAEQTNKKYTSGFINTSDKQTYYYRDDDARQSIANVETELEKVKVVSATTLPTNKIPVAGTSYKLGVIASLSLSGVPTSDYETTIYFTAGTGFQMSIPASTKIVGELSAEAGKSYVISIQNGVVIMGEITLSK